MLTFKIVSAVRVNFLPSLQTPAAIQQAVNQIRSTAKLQRITAFNSKNALVFSGTAGEVAAVEQLLQRYARN